MFFRKWRNEVKEILQSFHGSLTDLKRTLNHIEKELQTMSAELDSLTAAVAKNTAVTQAAVAQITLLTADKVDPAAITALTDQVTAASAALEAALPPAQ